MRSSGFQTRALEVRPHPLPNQGAVRARSAGPDQGCQIAAAQALFHDPDPASPTPTAFPFPACPVFPSLPRTLQSEMGRNSQASSAKIEPESASAPLRRRPEPSLGSPLPCLYSAPSSLLVPPILTTWPTQYRWFGSGSCSCSSSSGVLVRLRAPDALQALIPCLLPSPPPFAASPAPDCGCRCRCRGRRGEGRMERDAGWLGTAAGSGQLRSREREEMGAPLQPPWVPKCLRPLPARD